MVSRLLLGCALLAPLAALAADPQIAAITDTPDPVAAGGTYTYDIRIDNNAGDAAANTRLRLTVPSGATFVSAGDPSCVATTATQIDCNLGTLGANGGDVRNLAFVWRAQGPGPTSVSATAVVSADNDSNAANNTQNATTTVIAGADLGLGMTGSPDPVTGGGNVTYTITPTSNGPNAAGSIRVVDNLPPSTTFVSASGSGWSCSNASGVVTCDRSGTHAVGAAIPPITIVATVNAASGTITNSASVSPGSSGGVTDPEPSNNTAAVNTSVAGGANLSMAKSVTSATPAIAGANVTFQLQPRNAGPATATNARVTDTLPAGWTPVSASGTNWSCSIAGQVVTCNRASLPVGATDNLTVVATAPSNAAVGPTGTSYTNTASITNDVTDPVAGNNSDSVSVNVLPDGADLAIAKSKGPNPVAQGSPITSTITVTNNGPRAATGALRVVETLSGETYSSVSGAGWSCSAAGNVVTCDHANGGGLAVNASLPALSIVTIAATNGSATNTACTGSSLPAGAGAATARPPVEGDPNNTNDCASATTSSTLVQPDLSITKSATTANGDTTVSTTESSVTYTLVVTNASAGAQNATGVRITDTIPGFLSGRTTITTPITATVSAGSATFACSASGATVTCTQSGGVLAQGQTVTVPITVNRPFADGSYSNTASVTNTVEGDPNGANNTSNAAAITVQPIADIEMTGKTVTPSSVQAGVNATYVLSFRNNGPSTATGVALTDTFTFPVGDTGFTVVSIASSKAGSTCSIAAGAVLTPASNAFNCTIGSMADGETQSVTLVVRPNYQPGNGTRSVPNTAAVTTTSVENPAGGNNGNNSQSTTLEVTGAGVDLLVNKTDLVDPVPYFDPATSPYTFIDYRVRVTSNGPSYATNVRITETMTPPAGKRIRFICDTTAFGSATCNATPLCSVSNVTSAAGTAIPAFTCSVPAGNATTGTAVGDLASGQSKDIFLRAQVLDQPAPTGDVFNNLAVVSANEPDTFAANDSEGEQTTTRQRVDLAVTKSVSAPTVTMQQPYTWTIVVTNNGPGTSLQTDLTDTLPAGVSVTGAIAFTRTSPAGSGTCSLAGQAMTCALGQLDNGASATITIPARMTVYPSGGTLTNTATVDVDPAKIGGLDSIPGNNSGSATLSVTRSSITGTVFQDRDRAGANGGVPQAAGTEPRISGVSVRLTGTDAYGNAVDLTTTTDGSGNYTFANLAPSDASGYTVTETQPSGFVNGPVDPPTTGGSAPTSGGTYARGAAAGNSSYAAIVLGGNVAASNYNFPEVRQPTLSGFVYVDANASGVRDGADTAISGATVRLLDAGTLAVIATTTTNASGAYSFAGLDPFTTYVVEEPLPASPTNLSNGPVNPGQINGAACSSGCTAQANTPAAGTDRIAAIDLSAGTDGTNFNFGEIALTQISGTVYVDRNRNNAIDATPTDARLAGITITLYAGTSCSGTALATTTTDASGNYSFAGISAGQTYTVCEAQPAGYADGGVNPGGNGSSSAANSITITGLPVAGSANNHFAERVGSIAGSVWHDANNDGVRGGAENGIAGVVITLTGTDAAGTAVNRTATTDASGNYRFDDVLAANAAGYTLTEQAAQPAIGATTTLNGRTVAGTIGGSASGTATAVATTPSAISAIALPAGGDSIANNFGEILPVAISGTVFIDLNNNGVQNLPGDTGLANVTITITGTDDLGAVNRSITTAADGTYSVANLRPGTYTITEPTQPAGTSNGQTVPGSAGGTATAIGTVPSAISNIVLTTQGAASTANNFGEIANSSAINGRVWLDANNDGVADASEAGIANVTIELTGTDAAGQPVSRTTTTLANGDYAFTSLPPGTYTLREPTQPAGTVNGRTVAGSSGGTATAPAVAPSVIATIPLAVGQTSSANNFFEVPGARVSGRVWADNNNNGSIDTGEAGLSGVTITLTGTDDLGGAVNLTTTTAADGTYAFADLRPGTYTLTEPTQPAGTVNGITMPGPLGGTATAPATVPSAIAAIVLPPGGHASANNFGEIGWSSDLRVAKTHVETIFTVSKTATYRISVRNAGELATSASYTVSDRLPNGLTLASTPSGTNWSCVGAAGASSFDCTSSVVLAAGATGADTITVTVNVGAAAAANSPVNNAVMVDGGGEIDARRPSAAERDAFANNPAALPVCSATIEHNACRDPAPVQLAASISGTVWFDTGSTTRVLDGGDRRLPGWHVEIVDVANNAIVASTTTAADGSYRVPNLVPGVAYAVRFRDPGSNVVFGYPVNGESAPGSSGASCVNGTPPAGTASSCVGTGASPQLTVTLAPGQDLPQQSLPVDPSGVVYDSGLRQAVPGAVVALAPVGTCAGWNPASHIVGATLGGYTVNGSAISMTVGTEGLYQFLIAPSAPASCTFGLTVTPPAGYTFVSTAIAPTAGPLVPPGAAGTVYSVQPQAAAPTAAPGTGTAYYLELVIGSGRAGVVHNHIPLDPLLPTGIGLAKTGDRAMAEVGDTVRYTITVSVTAGARPRQTTVVDHLPAGFTYVRGTASVNGVAIADPQGGLGPTLAFNLGEMPATGQHVLRYRARVGVGAQQGDGINRAQAHACGQPSGCVGAGFAPNAGSVATNEARHRVRVSGGVFTTDACVLGKIFVDCNGNHVQDNEELGIPGVRLVLNDGTTLISDSEGKYSICGLPPKSHVLKVDPLTLPRGSRLTTTSNRNLGDAGSLWLDLKNGELHRADFAEGSCSNTVLEQVKARRAQGEVRAPEPEKKRGPALRFDSKAHGLDTQRSPQQGTDGANQQAPKVREPKREGAGATEDETNVPTPSLPMNQPPPPGRDSGQSPSSPASSDKQGGSDGKR
ncbi:MAG: SdrD B-like domain-containing protein [Burkholderiaceae bacterium]